MAIELGPEELVGSRESHGISVAPSGRPAPYPEISSFLSEAGRTLASFLNHEEALKRVARLAVPTISDWCVIDVVDEETGEITRLATTHSDPDKEKFGLELQRRYPPSPDQTSGPHQVVRTGEPELVAEITDAMLEATAQSEEHLRLLREVGLGSYMCVPLRARGEVLGAITCVAAESGRRFGTRDLHMLEDLARSAAVAMDNSLLFQDSQEARAKVEEALGLLDALFASAPVGLAFWDERFRYVRVNDCLASMNGLPREEHIGRTPSELLGDLGAGIEEYFRQVVETREPLTGLEVSGVTPAAPGEVRHWVADYYPVLSPSGSVLGVGAVIVDVSERKRAEDALSRSEELFRLLVEGISDHAVFMLDPDGLVESWNFGAEQIMGYSPDEIIGRPFSVFYAPEEVGAGKPQELLRVAAESGRSEHEGWRVCKSGERIWCNTVVTALYDDAGLLRGFSNVTRDISERKSMEEQLKHRALHDPLTGLANRTLFRDRVQHAFSRRERRDDALAVIFIDLDDFKKINDTLGHDGGDELLIQVGGRLKECIRPSDTAARIGGDEFAVLVDDLRGPEDAGRVAERILASLREPFACGSNAVRTYGSLGVVANPVGQSPEETMRNADLAMYVAKASGKGRYEIFEPSMHAAARKRSERQDDLRRALDEDELTLHYQPILDLTTKRIVGVEALLRWQHPGDGLLAPATFMPFAEETGLIHPIGSWVLKNAIANGVLLQAEATGAPPLSMSVNLSPKQFHTASLIDDVAAALHDSGMSPDSLILEVTENALAQGLEDNVGKLAKLRELGVRIAIDHFGSGYSSLTNLRQFPVDILSLDRSFVEGIKPDSAESDLAAALVRLCGTLEVNTLAEGIERREQLVKLSELGFDEGQGFYLSKPLTFDEMVKLLHSAAPVA